MVKQNKKDEVIKEFVRRRDEVVKRAALTANKKLPQSILRSARSDADILEWIITPHLRKEYDPVQKISDEVLRRGTDLVSAYLHDKGDNTEEEPNETEDK